MRLGVTALYDGSAVSGLSEDCLGAGQARDGGFLFDPDRRDRRGFRDESPRRSPAKFRISLRRLVSSVRRSREISLDGWHPAPRWKASMNFKTGSFSPRLDELTEGTQSTPSDTRRELSSRSGSGTDAARDGQSRTQSSMASAAGVGSKIAEEDSD